MVAHSSVSSTWLQKQGRPLLDTPCLSRKTEQKRLETELSDSVFSGLRLTSCLQRKERKENDESTRAVTSRAGEAERGIKVLNIKLPLDSVRFLYVDYGNGHCTRPVNW